jgi:DNA-directed RNA polymerase specialized sigma24 family protein
VDEPWFEALRSGDVEGAWSAFVDRYRRLILATIRHYLQDYDDVMDAFARVCETLRENELARLRRFEDRVDRPAQFSTWLVTVVRNCVIDWVRHRDGRPRLTAAMRSLPPLQQRICQYVFLDGRSHVEAFELIRTSEDPSLTFGNYLNQLAATYRVLSDGKRGALLRDLAGPPSGVEPESLSANAPPADLETNSTIADVLRRLPPEDQLAVQLFVIEELPAAEVARLVGWRNAKAVYNRVYRVLADLRSSLERKGIRREDM